MLASGFMEPIGFPIDVRAPGALRYDGSGGLSAGASSRLLFDYPEPARSHVLDMLFLPHVGAAIHHLKVEIGGDSQSTDGTEASHMHERNDLSCARGYEFWLLKEARARNPEIVTYALSWAVPWWISNQTGYYAGRDNIDYHIAWLRCATSYGGIGLINYIGNWNERGWGPAEWTTSLRSSMDAAGFKSTSIIIPDGTWYQAEAILPTVAKDAAFKHALEGGGIGLHYPSKYDCGSRCKAAQENGLKMWASEDWATAADWDGASCWGRLLNLNWVERRMTSTIAWSLVWSVYPGMPYAGSTTHPDGPGLMLAREPWSGHYDLAGGAIWTTAHTTQFTAVGWDIVGGGALARGGSFVVYASPSHRSDRVDVDVTIVVEKLEGKCMHAPSVATAMEMVNLTLVNMSSLPRTLSMWSTNRTHQFIRRANVSISAAGHLTFSAARDTIYTLSTTSGQAKGVRPIPPSAPFPAAQSDDFDATPLAQPARFFADNGGSFEIVADPSGSNASNRVLAQTVTKPAGKNQWVLDMEPITLTANGEVCDHELNVDVYVPSHAEREADGLHVTDGLRVANSVTDPASYMGVCGRVPPPQLMGQTRLKAGYCLIVETVPRRWRLVVATPLGKLNATWSSLDAGALDDAAGPWHTLRLTMHGAALQATVDGVSSKSIQNATYGAKGFASLVSGWGRAFFDNWGLRAL